MSQHAMSVNDVTDLLSSSKTKKAYDGKKGHQYWLIMSLTLHDCLL
jgi:hypothetical protein